MQSVHIIKSKHEKKSRALVRVAMLPVRGTMQLECMLEEVPSQGEEWVLVH